MSTSTNDSPCPISQRENDNDPNENYDLEYEIDCTTLQRAIKIATPRRLISELFSLSLTFMNQFFDTYPLYLEPRFLLDTLIKIFNQEEEVDTMVPSPTSTNASGENSYSSSQETSSSFRMPCEISSLTSQSPDSEAANNQAGGAKSFNEKTLGGGSSGKKQNSGLNYLSSNFSIMKRNSKKRQNSDESNNSKTNSELTADSPFSAKQLLSNHLRVLKIISHWISKYYIDFQNDHELRETLLKFMRTLINNEEGNEKKSILYTRASLVVSAITQCEKERENKSDEINEFKRDEHLLYEFQSAISCEINLMDYDVVYIAYGFTQISIQLQKDINIRELTNVSWMKEDKKSRTLSIMKITENFNKTTQLIKKHILKNNKASKRAKVIEFWLDVAEQLYKLDNYNVISMISGAMESNVIYRLNKTWSKVSKKSTKIREWLQELVNATSNYASLRSHYNKENFIPFMGPFLTELCYIEERNLLNPGSGKVNFKKMRAISKVISPIRKAIDYKFAIPMHLDSYKIIMRFYNQQPIPDQELIDLSTTYEPNE